MSIITKLLIGIWLIGGWVTAFALWWHYEPISCAGIVTITGKPTNVVMSGNYCQGRCRFDFPDNLQSAEIVNNALTGCK